MQVLWGVLHPDDQCMYDGDHLDDPRGHVHGRFRIRVKREMQPMIGQTGDRDPHPLLAGQLLLDIGHGRITQIPRQKPGPRVLVTFGDARQVAVLVRAPGNSCVREHFEGSFSNHAFTSRIVYVVIAGIIRDVVSDAYLEVGQKVLICKRIPEHPRPSLPDAALDQRILALASDFGTVWEAARTTNEDRKRLLGLLIEDITLIRRVYQVNVGLRLRGGRTHELPPVALPLPRATVIGRDASKQALAELEELLEAGYDDPQAAEELNLRGYRDSLGGRFNAQRIRTIRVRNKMPRGIERQREKMRAQGYKTAKELAAELAIDAATIGRLAREGRGIDEHRIPGRKRTFAMYRISPKTRTTPTVA